MMENIKDSKSRLALSKSGEEEPQRSENIRMNGLLARSLAYPIDVLFSRVNVRNLIAE